jgi:hypothetical protein
MAWGPTWLAYTHFSPAATGHSGDPALVVVPEDPPAPPEFPVPPEPPEPPDLEVADGEPPEAPEPPGLAEHPATSSAATPRVLAKTPAAARPVR